MENLAQKASQQMPIDFWFAEQDRAVDAELKLIRRSSRRRRREPEIDLAELERRTIERVAAEQEQCAIEIAIARAVYKEFGLRTIIDPERDFKDVLVEGLARAAPGKTFNGYPLHARACHTGDSEELRPRHVSVHYAEVRRELAKEMADELQADPPRAVTRRAKNRAA